MIGCQSEAGGGSGQEAEAAEQPAGEAVQGGDGGPVKVGERLLQAKAIGVPQVGCGVAECGEERVVASRQPWGCQEALGGRQPVPHPVA